MGFIGARLREVRTARGLTQDALADRAGMPRTDISKAENDKLSVGHDRLARLAAALEVSVLELQPEAEADALGLTLARRLEDAEAALNHLAPLVERLESRVAALEKRSQPSKRTAASRR